METPLSMVPAVFVCSPQALAQVKVLYSELQSRLGQGPALGEQGRRVQSIGQEAQALFQETMGIMLRMESKALTNSVPSCPGEEALYRRGVRERSVNALGAVRGWDLGCSWCCCARKLRVFKGATVGGKPCLQCQCAPVSLHTLTSIFKHSKLMALLGVVFWGCLEGGEQRQCRMLVFLPRQSCAGRRWRLSPTPSRNLSLPCPLSSALESEIQERNEALVSRMSRLSGLEEQVGRIRDTIKRKVAYYESCS